MHDSWTYEGKAIEELDIIGRDDLQYLWLPLSPRRSARSLLAVQLQIGFATAVDGRIDKIVENLAVVQPTFMAGAPRIFEKVRARVIAPRGAGRGRRRKIFDWAFGVGRKAVPMRPAAQQPTGLLAVQYAARRQAGVQQDPARLGGRIRFFVSGSAALSRGGAGVVLRGRHADPRGLRADRDQRGHAASTDPRATRFGTVGPPLPGTEVKIAEDGEILLQGSGRDARLPQPPGGDRGGVRRRLVRTPATSASSTSGYLRITDRKKDLIKTSGGKYVAPQKVENAFKTVCPYASQVVVHGEGRKYVSALLTLDPEAITGWAADNGHDASDYESCLGSAPVRELLEGYVAQANGQLERWETIKRFEVLDRELSVEEGEVTPSLKIRRRAVEKKYEGVLNSLYDSD